MPDKLKTLYNNIIASKVATPENIGDFQGFEDAMRTPKNRATLYNKLKANGVSENNIGDKNTFTQMIGDYYAIPAPGTIKKPISENTGTQNVSQDATRGGDNNIPALLENYKTAMAKVQKQPIVSNAKGSNLPEVNVTAVPTTSYWYNAANHPTTDFSKFPQKTQQFLVSIANQRERDVLSGAILESPEIKALAPDDYLKAVAQQKAAQGKIEAQKTAKENYISNASIDKLSKAQQFQNEPQVTTYGVGATGLPFTVSQPTGELSPQAQQENQLNATSDTLDKLSSYITLLSNKQDLTPQENSDLEQSKIAFNKTLNTYTQQAKDYQGKIKEYPYYIPKGDVNILSKETHVPAGVIKTASNSIIGKGILIAMQQNPDFRNYQPSKALAIGEQVTGIALDYPVFAGLGQLSEGITNLGIKALSKLPLNEEVVSSLDDITKAASEYTAKGSSAKEAYAKAFEDLPQQAKNVKAAFTAAQTVEQGINLGAYNAASDLLTQVENQKNATLGTPSVIDGKKYHIVQSDGDEVQLADDKGNKLTLTPKEYQDKVGISFGEVGKSAATGLLGGASMPIVGEMSDAIMSGAGISAAAPQSAAQLFAQSYAFAAAGSVIKKGKTPTADEVWQSVFFLGGMELGGKISELSDFHQNFDKYFNADANKDYTKGQLLTKVMSVAKSLGDEDVNKKMGDLDLRNSANNYAKETIDKIKSKDGKIIQVKDKEGNILYVKAGATVKDGQLTSEGAGVIVTDIDGNKQIFAPTSLTLVGEDTPENMQNVISEEVYNKTKSEQEPVATEQPVQPTQEPVTPRQPPVVQPEPIQPETPPEVAPLPTDKNGKVSYDKLLEQAPERFKEEFVKKLGTKDANLYFDNIKTGLSKSIANLGDALHKSTSPDEIISIKERIGLLEQSLKSLRNDNTAENKPVTPAEPVKPEPVKSAESNTNTGTEANGDNLQQPAENGTADRNKLEEKPVIELKPKAKPIVNPNGLYAKTSNLEPTDPIGLALQYFATGGKINQEALRKIFGDNPGDVKYSNSKIENERKLRISIYAKDGSSIDQIAHALWENNSDKLNFTTQDYKNAIEEVLTTHNSRAAMAKELLSTHEIDKEKEANFGYTNEEVDKFAKEAETNDRKLQEEEARQHIKELDKTGKHLTPEQEAELFGHITPQENGQERTNEGSQKGYNPNGEEVRDNGTRSSVTPEGQAGTAEPKIEAVKEPSKQAWQMTKEEYLKFRKNQLKGTKSKSPEQYYANSTPEQSRYNWENQMGKYHQEIVEEALSEGKAVPEEVLKEYPDLQKEAETSQPATKVEEPKKELSKAELRTQKFTEINNELGDELNKLAGSLGIIKNLTGEKRDDVVKTIGKITKLLAEKFVLKGAELKDAILEYLKFNKMPIDEDVKTIVQDHVDKLEAGNEKEPAPIKEEPKLSDYTNPDVRPAFHLSDKSLKTLFEGHEFKNLLRGVTQERDRAFYSKLGTHIEDEEAKKGIDVTAVASKLDLPRDIQKTNETEVTDPETGRNFVVMDDLKSPQDVEDLIDKGRLASGARQIREARAEHFKEIPVPPGRSMSPEDILKMGEESIRDGADPYEPVRRLKDGLGVSETGNAIAQAYTIKLQQAANLAEDDLFENPNSKEAQKTFEEAKKKAHDYEEATQILRTEASGSLRAWNIAKTDQNSYVGLSKYNKDVTGNDFSEKEAKKAKDIINENKQLRGEVAEVQSKLQNVMNENLSLRDETKSKKSYTDIGNRLADKVLKVKISRPGMFMVATPASLVWDASVDVVAKTLREGGKLIDAINNGIENMKKSDWYKKLPGWQQNVAENQFKEHHYDILNSKATLAELQDEFGDKKDNKFTPNEVRRIWQYTKDNYVDNGYDDFGDVIHGVSKDLGLSAKQVIEAFSQPKGARELMDDMFMKMRKRREVQNHAKNWVVYKDASNFEKVLAIVPKTLFSLKVLGHGGVGMITHVGRMMFNPWDWDIYMKNFIEQYKLIGSKKYHARAMFALENDPNFAPWLRATLAIDPHRIYDDYRLFGEFFNKISGLGNRGFDVLKLYRFDLANRIWGHLSQEERSDPLMMHKIAVYVNHMSGTVNARGFAPALNYAFFAPRLEASRWAAWFKDPYKAIDTYARIAMGKNVSPSDRFMAKLIARNAGSMLATYAGLLTGNQAILKMTGSPYRINFLDPTKSNWMKFNIDGHAVALDGGMINVMGLIGSLAAISYLPPKMVGGKLSSRRQDLLDELAKYVSYKASPFASTAWTLAAKEDFNKNQLWYSNAPVAPGKEKLSPLEYFWRDLSPIPLEEGGKAVREQMKIGGVNKASTNMLFQGALVGLLSGTTGVRIGAKYPPRTPTEIALHEAYQSRRPNYQVKNIEDNYFRTHDLRKLVVAYKEGHITPTTFKSIVRLGKKTELQREIMPLNYEGAFHVYKAATPEQKKELKRMLKIKIARAKYPTMPQSEKDLMNKMLNYIK